MRKQRWAIYLFFQAGMCTGWWVLLALRPTSRGLFRPANGSDAMTLSFWLADLVCFIGGSVLTGWWLMRDDPRSRNALWFTAGAASYSGLYALALSLATHEAWTATAMMVPAALGTLTAAWRTSKG